MRNKFITMVGALLLAAFPVFAAYDAFMKIEGVPGESKAPGHESWIEIQSFSWGVTQPSAQGVGKQSPHELTITKRIDKSSPTLQKAAMTGQSFQNVTLDLNGQRYMLQGVLIGLLRQLPPAGNDQVPREEVKLVFQRDLTHDSPVGGGPTHKDKYDWKLNSNATLNGGALFGPPAAIMLRSLHQTGNNSAIIVVCDVAGSQGVAQLQRAAMSKQKFNELTFAVHSNAQQKATGAGYKELPAVQFTFGDGSVRGAQVNGDGCTQFSLNFTRFSGPASGYDWIK